MVLDFVQTHLSGRAIDTYEGNEGAKVLAENPKGSHRSKNMDPRFHFLRGLARGAGNNSQHSLGGTTCGHPYEATRSRVVQEAPWFSDESFARVFVSWM